MKLFPLIQVLPHLIYHKLVNSLIRRDYQLYLLLCCGIILYFDAWQS